MFDFITTIIFSGFFYTQTDVISLDQDSVSNSYCTDTTCYFPKKSMIDQDIHIKSSINWDSNKNLVVHTRGDVVFKKGAKITSTNDGSIIVQAGMEPGKKDEYTSTIIFEEDKDPFKKTGIQIETLGSGEIKIYYNPLKNPGDDHPFKYHNPKGYTYSLHTKTRDSDKFAAYMLVNDEYDLQNILTFPHGNYALSQDINAHETKNWHKGKGFKPLPFTGDFDGNGYTISEVYINYPDRDDVGLFEKAKNSEIKNLVIKDFDITGSYYVGSLVGFAVKTKISNIKVINSKIKGHNVVGGLIGTSDRVQVYQTQLDPNLVIIGQENTGFIVGGAREAQAEISFINQQERDGIMEKNKLLGVQDEHTTICLITENNYRQICLKSSSDGDAGMIIPIPTPDSSKLNKVMVTIGSKALTVEHQKDFVLAGEKVYNEFEKQKTIKYDKIKVDL